MHKSRTAERKARAESIISKLEKDSPLFGSSDEAKRLPVFDNNEVARGAQLGEGEFSIVREIVRFKVPEKCDCVLHGGACEGGLGNLDTFTGTPSTIGEAAIGEGLQDDFDNHEDFTDDDEPGTGDEDRGFMKEHCFREGSARYAIKQLKPASTPDEQSEAIIDLAMEAKFLTLLSHSNIIKMRGTGGTPCHPEYFIVPDRLYDTLEERIDIWADEKKRLKGVMGVFGKRKEDLQHLFSDWLLAALDIARAMKYLHSQKVLFRDLKPENIVSTMHFILHSCVSILCVI